MRGCRALAGASNLLGYKEYTQQDLVLNTRLTDYLFPYKLTRGWVATIYTLKHGFHMPPKLSEKFL